MISVYDDNLFPIPYLITFRCYGTWLHGDQRGTMDRRGHNVYGTPGIPHNEKLEKSDRTQLKYPAFLLTAIDRALVEQAIREVCLHREYILRVVNVRTNHVHTVVSANAYPEPVMNAFKAYATRRLRRSGRLAADLSPWERHGSTRYLWKPHHVESAISYVINGQGDEPPEFH